MKAKILKLFFSILMITSVFETFAQMDNLHYVPPFYGRVNVDQHYMIISTLETYAVPFEVTDGAGNSIRTGVVTKATPLTFSLGTGYGATGLLSTAELNTVTNEGLIVQSTDVLESPIFVNIRHVQSAQGLSLTSKGDDVAPGTAFRTGHVISNNQQETQKAHFISVMALEDNTVVNFGDFKNNVVFHNTPTTGGTSDPISVTLNAGESYVIATHMDENMTVPNDVNGTLVTSDKEIVVNCGSWLGGNDKDGKRDIGVDQLVPVESVSTEYAFIAGKGNADNERPLVIATEDGTQVFVNGVLYATLNAGEYLYIDNSEYSNDDNMYISTSKPIYMYQVMCGPTPANQSLNFIPPIRCSGNNEVLIPNVDLIGNAELAITARAGATVTVNGTVLGVGDPVIGNPYWVTHKVSTNGGDYSVVSDSVVNVALVNHQGNRGGAGYFSGFARFNQTAIGDTNTFVICDDYTETFVTYNMAGPYYEVSYDYLSPGKGVIDTLGTSNDTLFFSYTRTPGAIGIDSIDVTVCKEIVCGGSAPDSACEVSTFYFNAVSVVDAGIGDSIAVCNDTSVLSLPNYLLGTPLSGGTWVDMDNTGAIFNGNEVDPSLLSPGTYRFGYAVESNPAFCFDTAFVKITVLPNTVAQCCRIDILPTVTDVLCNGGNTGGVQVLDTFYNATNYSINGAAYQGSPLFSNLTVGAYQVVGMYGAGVCTDTIDVVISEPTALAITGIIDSVTCNAGTDGQVNMTVTGGVLPYSYTLNGGVAQNNGLFTNLSQGPVFVQVTDSNNCIIDTTGVVFEPPLLIMSIDTIIGASCNFNNGEIRVSSVGGNTGAFTYTLSGPSTGTNTTGVFTNLPFGTYSVTVTDVKSCSDVILNIVVPDLGMPVPSIVLANNLNCISDASGEIILGVTGGTSPYLFTNLTVTPQQDSSRFVGLPAGTYNIEVEDANGCLDTITQLITEPADFIVSNQVVTDPTCNGACDGEISITMSGGTSPYYMNGVLFDSGLNTTVSNICAGNTTLNITDANGCGNTPTIIVAEPAMLVVTPVVDSVICYSEANGQIDLQATGGSGTYEYSIDGGSTYLSGDLITGLDANFHSILLRDAAAINCEINEVVLVEEPALLRADVIAAIDATCGNATGGFTVEATGGNGTSYNFTEGANTGTGTTYIASGLGSGVYFVNVTDYKGCSVSQSIGVSDQSLGFTVGNTSVDSVTCFGGTNGSVSITPIGGACSGGTCYTYYLDDMTNPQGQGNLTHTFTGLSAGQYTIGVEDESNCREFSQFYVEQPERIRVNLQSTALTCHTLDGLADGQIDVVNSSGGSLPFYGYKGGYEYSIDGTNFQPTTNFSNLGVGNYTITVRDTEDASCTVTNIVTVNEPNRLNFNYSFSELLCFGDDNGLLLIENTSGGSGVFYEYSIDLGVNYSPLPFFQNLAANNYTISVRDNNLCQRDSNVVLSQPAELQISSVFDNNTSCFDVCDGQITLSAIGGVLGTSYYYSMDNGLNYTSNNVFGNLCDGSYNGIVRDDNGCLDTVSVADVITEPSDIAFTYTDVNATCGLDNAELNLMASGGTAVANGADVYNFSINNLTSQELGNGNAPGLNYPGLSIGRYYISVEDDNGCMKDTSVLLQADLLPILSGRVTATPLCFGGNEGAVEITGNSGTGSGTYEFSSDGITYVADPTDVVTYGSLLNGTYTFYMRDANSCIDQIDLAITQPDTLVVDLTNTILTDLTCYNDGTGSIEMIISGGVPSYQYSIDGGLTYSSSNVFNALQADSFKLAVRDVNGCTTLIDDSVGIGQPGELFASIVGFTNPTCYNYADGDITVTAGYNPVPYPIQPGNPGGLIYRWNTGATGTTATGLIGVPGQNSYTMIVTDANGCSESVVQSLIAPATPVVDSYTTDPVLCFGDDNGNIAIQSSSATLFQVTKAYDPFGNRLNSYDGLQSVNDTLFNLEHGYYTIRAYDANNCAGRVEKNIYVGSPQELNPIASGNGNDICANVVDTLLGVVLGGTSPFTYEWKRNTNNTNFVSITNTKDAYFTNGNAGNTDDFRFIVVDANGCTDSSQINLVVADVPVINTVTMPDTTFCAGDVVFLQPEVTGGVGNYVYDWTNGVNYSTTFTSSVYTDSTIILNIYDNCTQFNGNAVSDTVQVTIVSANGINLIVNPGTNCPGQPIAVSSSYTSNVQAYEWIIDGVTYTDSLANVVLENEGCYDVDLTLYVGTQNCPIDTMFNNGICVNPKPIADFEHKPNKPTMLNPLVNFENTSINDTLAYEWRIPNFNNLVDSTFEPIVLFPEEEAAYSVWLKATNTFGCSDSIMKIVKINKIDNIFVPNTFTPNGDGINDVFLPVLYNINTSTYELLVYDRWGRKVFESHNPFEGWTGDNFNDGVYVWKITAESNDGTEYVLKGTVNLVH